jgi:SpoVK/Ycf46/Vps4 family AAA+-type ATPase
MVVSKYIGETEKNLENLFAKAETKNWILFFDEADALFGKRTGVRDAHDKYANQEVSYLLQRVEDFDGLVILASNMKNNIDDAFIRRFNAIIRFPLPDESDRAMIWRKSFPNHIAFNNNVDIPEMVKKYELTGGNIINVVQYSCLKSLEAQSNEIFLNHVLNGIKREMYKEGKPFNVNGK